MADEKPQSGETREKDPRRDKAKELWERLARSRPGPANSDLIYLARFVPLLSTSALKTLFARKLSIAELRELVQHVPKARELAAKRILEFDAEDVTEDDVRFLLSETKIPDVARVLLKRFPTDANLGLVERTVESLKETVEKMRSQETTTSVMKEIDRKL